MRAPAIRQVLAFAALLLCTAGGASVWCAPASARDTAQSSGGHVRRGDRLLGAPGASAPLVDPLGPPASPLDTGVTGLAVNAATGGVLNALGDWVVGSATFVLKHTAHIVGETTAPRLDSTWFSGAYWRVAGIASVLTLPFLFAASVQALIRSDLTLVVRAAAAYLPVAMLMVAIAAPVTTLLLSASDQLAGVVSSAAGHDGVNFLSRLVVPLGALSAISSSPFLGFVMALFTIAGALMLWIELLIRQAGVYVIVLMLPVAFAAFVWPARRIWAIRSVELLVALILSKFVIVAVLSLGAAALGHSVSDGLTTALAGVVMLVLGAFAPWALLRLIPLAELASAAAGGLRAHAGGAVMALQRADAWAGSERDRWATRTAAMRRSADVAKPPPVELNDGAVVAGSREATDRLVAEPPESSDIPSEGGVPPEPNDIPRDTRPVPTDIPSETRPAPEANHIPNAAAGSLGPDEVPDAGAPKPAAEWITTGDAFVHMATPPIDASRESDT